MKNVRSLIFFLLATLVLSGGLFSGNKVLAGSNRLAGDGPLLTGPTSVCLNSTGNVYTTDQGMTSYVWTVTGGTITSGGNATSYTCTVTWTSAGAKSISVTYLGAGATTTLPVTVNPLTASVSVSASATNVSTGTPVTFTATATNGGPTPTFQWRVNNVIAGNNSPSFTYTPLNGDIVFCYLYSSATCVNPATPYLSNLITMTVTSMPLLVTVSTLGASPGQVLTIPVKLKGAGTTGTPVSAATIELTYNPAVLQYNGLQNFYTGIPEPQWYYNGGNGLISANWQHPTLGTSAVPDSTTLFEISFTYVGGSSALTFTTYDFTDALFNLVNTSVLNGSVAQIAALSGPQVTCQGVDGNVYQTDSGKSNYLWTVIGGTITAGGTSSSNTATVNWTSAGAQGISVAYAGSVVTSLPVTVNPSAPVSVSISASNNNLCAGTPVTFTAIPVNGGSVPAYQWRKNGTTISGATLATYSYSPANNDAITCVLTSNATCATGSPATSNSLVMAVNATTASISIAASANPSVIGNPVTFTATPVNGGVTPIFEWRVNNAVAGTNSNTLTYTPVSGDVVYCYLKSSSPCVNPNSIFLSNIITMTVNYPTFNLQVTLPAKTAMPGDILSYPVKLKGADVSGWPIQGMTLQITFDHTVLQYGGVSNFFSGMPQGEYFINCTGDNFYANWQEPSLLATAVPDSTTLFEIQFTYAGGTSNVAYATAEFQESTYGQLVEASKVNGNVSQLVPNTRTVQNQTLGNGQTGCYDALQAITVAGSGSTFAVDAGGSATFVAGQSIGFLPGVTVAVGGYLWGHITTTNSFCGAQAPPIMAAEKEETITDASPSTSSSPRVRAYPNPTSGTVTLDLSGCDNNTLSRADVFTVSGMKVSSLGLGDSRKHDIRLTGLTPGIYFIHVFTQRGPEVVKIVKY